MPMLAASSALFVHSRIFLHQYMRMKPWILPRCTSSSCEAFHSSSCVLAWSSCCLHRQAAAAQEGGRGDQENAAPMPAGVSAWTHGCRCPRSTLLSLCFGPTEAFPKPSLPLHTLCRGARACPSCAAPANPAPIQRRSPGCHTSRGSSGRSCHLAHVAPPAPPGSFPPPPCICAAVRARQGLRTPESVHIQDGCRDPRPTNSVLGVTVVERVFRYDHVMRARVAAWLTRLTLQPPPAHKECNGSDDVLGAVLGGLERRALRRELAIVQVWRQVGERARSRVVAFVGI
eukprot:359501-Chlamydomonas_euryale.AAC.5